MVLPRLVSSLKDTSLLPNIVRAEKKYLVPIIGQALYADIQTKYDGNTIGGSDATLLQMMQLVIAAHAYYDEMGLNNAFLTDGGVRTINSNNTTKAFKYEYLDLKNALLDAAVDGVETLLAELEQQQNALWVAAPEYTAYKQLLIKTGLEFNKIERLNQPLRTFWIMRSTVEDVQHHYLDTGIGPDLVDYLRAAAAPTTAETRIIKYLKKALASFTIKHALAKFSGRFDSNGFTIVSTTGGDQDNDETAGRAGNTSLLNLKMKEHESNGKVYLAQALFECYQYYNDAASSAGFKTAYAAGPLASYKAPADRDKGNCRRQIFRL